MGFKRCKSCGKYTLKDKCPNCESKTTNPHPAPFSPEDRYGDYRREEKLKKGS